MNKKFFNPYTYVLLIVAAVLILAGNLFRVQHWPYSHMMERIGFLSFFFVGSFEIGRLKRVIRELTNNTK